jgi:hypothetical protein
MSRGPGRLQRAIFETIRKHGKPMTFAEIQNMAFPEGTYDGDMARALGASNVGVIRSMRRAIQKMVEQEVLVAAGNGGRGDARRYSIHPIIAAMCRGDASTGKLLLEVRPQIATGDEWRDWIKQFGMTVEDAERCIDAARRAGAMQKPDAS